MPGSSGPPPATCPIAWQPHAFAPVFFGARSLSTTDGAPVAMRVFFPSLDGSVETAPVLSGCARYPLVVFVHGHCTGDPEHHRRWFRLPAQLARSGYVVVVPRLPGISGGQSPSVLSHPDLPLLSSVVAWMRTGWPERGVLLPEPATAVVGHSFGAMLGARYAVTQPVSAYAGLSGGWHDWFGDAPRPLSELRIPNLLVWGGDSDLFTQLSESEWQQIRPPRHRVVFAEGEHWDYLGAAQPPCSTGGGVCPEIGAAVDDLVTMFLARYLPPELAADLPAFVPASLEPPAWPAADLTFEQEFFAGGFLNGWSRLSGTACAATVSEVAERLVANRRTKETHSLDRPCAFVDLISTANRREVSARPPGYRWCDVCYPRRADG